MSEEPAASADRETGAQSNRVYAFARRFLLALAVYLVSPVPVEFVLDQLPPETADRLFPMFQVVYAPIIRLDDNVEFVRTFYDWQATFFDT